MLGQQKIEEAVHTTCTALILMVMLPDAAASLAVHVLCARLVLTEGAVF